jgi:methyltransferase
MASGTLLLAFITAQRLGELAFARANTARILAHGGIEYGARYYAIVVIVHVLWLAGLWALGHDRPVDLLFLAVFVALQVVRYWSIASLGQRWTMRIVAVPGEPLVTRGPYRFTRHPNYAVVILEAGVVPLALGLPFYAAVSFLVMAVVIGFKIRIENGSLRSAML